MKAVKYIMLAVSVAAFTGILSGCVTPPRFKEKYKHGGRNYTYNVVDTATGFIIYMNYTVQELNPDNSCLIAQQARQKLIMIAQCIAKGRKKAIEPITHDMIEGEMDRNTFNQKTYWHGNLKVKYLEKKATKK
ncbi:hypothetical protein P0136_06105 [Lentisphaerota bacterium ZTH]|nr:hypothetical protein JYG24_02785 [Lentisphaerota bacterium]WET07562.1 hypothetical protein P0136_06105 [Lentisphaerota bacterium ZTH]